MDDVIDEIPDGLSNSRKWLGNRNIDSFLDARHSINSVTAPSGYQIYTVKGRKYIRRLDASNPYTPRLMVDKDGIIVKYTKSIRNNNQNKFINNLKKIFGDLPPNHQRHHLVSVNIVDGSPLHQEAIRRNLYSVDRGSNGRYLAETADDFNLDPQSMSQNYPTHLGSHPNYDNSILSEIEDLVIDGGIDVSNLSELSDSDLLDYLDEIEDLALDVLEGWNFSKLN